MENFRFLSSPCLIGLTDDLDLFNLPNLTGFNLDALEFIGDDETRFTRLPLLTKLSLPSLFFLGDTIEVDEMTSLEEIDLPKLYAVNRAFDISNVPALKVVRMPSLALSGQTSGWDVEGPVPSPSGFTFELCSLPAFEVRYFFNGRICTDGSTTKCTAVGAGSTECASGSKKEKKGGGALAGLFDFSGDTKVLPDGGKIWGKEPNHVLGLSDDKFDGLFGSGAGKQKRGANAEADGCLPVFPADLPEKKQAPVCGNGLVELGEECDGDAAVCDNESCTLKDSPEVVCELDGGTVINSLADFDALRGCAVIILSFSFDPPVAPVLVIGNSMEIPTNFSLPLLQAFYGTLEISNDPGNVVEVLSFPSAWKFGFITWNAPTDDRRTALQSVDLPCARQVGSFRTEHSPEFSRLFVPKLQVLGTLLLTNQAAGPPCADASTPFDLTFPDLFFIGAFDVEECDGPRRVLMPSLLAQNSDLNFDRNANLEVVSQPKMSKIASRINSLSENPSLRLIDRSSQTFIESIGEFSDYSPEGLELLLCSLNAFQFNTKAVERCMTTDTPPCFLFGAGDDSDRCREATGIIKGKHVTVEAEKNTWGGLGDLADSLDLSGLFKG